MFLDCLRHRSLDEIFAVVNVSRTSDDDRQEQESFEAIGRDHLAPTRRVVTVLAWTTRLALSSIVLPCLQSCALSTSKSHNGNMANL